jgi:hypothetical protein
VTSALIPSTRIDVRGERDIAVVDHGAAGALDRPVAVSISWPQLGISMMILVL